MYTKTNSWWLKQCCEGKEASELVQSLFLLRGGRSWSDPPLVFHIFLLLSSVRRNLGSLGSLDFLPSSSLPSLFLGGLRSGLFWDIVALLVFAPIVSTPRHLHADRWDHASPSRFFFDPLTVCTCAGGVIGFAVVVFSCSSWVRSVVLMGVAGLLVVCGAAPGLLLCSRSTTVLTGLKRGNAGSGVRCCV
ncbi:hypothetical protein ACOSQ4_019675 [Xanthoceras sorbifolium]